LTTTEPNAPPLPCFWLQEVLQKGLPGKLEQVQALASLLGRTRGRTLQQQQLPPALAPVMQLCTTLVTEVLELAGGSTGPGAEEPSQPEGPSRPQGPSGSVGLPVGLLLDLLLTSYHYGQAQLQQQLAAAAGEVVAGRAAPADAQAVRALEAVVALLKSAQELAVQPGAI